MTLLAMVAAATGLAAGVTVDDEFLFLVLSMLGLAGMAMANVLLPSLVKLTSPTGSAGSPRSTRPRCPSA